MMISANRLLLQRLPATHTLQRIGRRHISRRVVGWDSTRSIIPNIASPSSTTVVRLPADGSDCGNALFSSTAAAVETEAEDASSSSTATDEAVDEAQVEPSSAEKDEATAVETEGKSSSAKTYAHVVEGNKQEVSADQEEAKKILRKGTLKWIDYSKGSGLIIQDEEYRNIGPVQTEGVLLHFRDIYPMWRKSYFIEQEHWAPAIETGARLQFYVHTYEDANKKTKLNANDVRFEGGGDISLMSWKGSLGTIQRAKKSLGHNVYNILSEASSVGNEDEIAKKVEFERKKCMERVEWARNQIAIPAKAARDRKAQLGDEIWDLLSNIGTVDDIEKRADDAYYQCVEDLVALGLDNLPNSTKSQEEESGFKALIGRK